MMIEVLQGVWIGPNIVGKMQQQNYEVNVSVAGTTRIRISIYFTFFKKSITIYILVKNKINVLLFQKRR